ncbi:hypothetical protein Z043_106729 [Scleropages formosus]|uniref:Uncharacterized protein n=1 Tax=Scleropages formosus TaxID=113540 RepID=A0A0N8K173_SCLFO|nr:hypothetical protein Z043_106729 [Scleropages formosus]
MLYCCGSSEEKERLSGEVLMKREEEGAPRRGDIHDAPEMPELLPPTSPLQPGPLRPDGARLQAAGAGSRGGSLSFDSPQRRLGQRAPKLGQIGRSKKGGSRPGSPTHE